MGSSYQKATDFYKSKEWFACKAAYLEEVRELCEICYSEKRLSYADAVYHKIRIREISEGDNITIDPKDLIAVCEWHLNALLSRRYYFDESGELIKPEGSLNE